MFLPEKSLAIRLFSHRKANSNSFVELTKTNLRLKIYLAIYSINVICRE